MKKLEELPNGDGGFVVLATCCFLYERYAKAILKSSGQKANTEDLILQLANDFQVDEETADAFWDVIRNGFLHQGMAKQSDRSGSLPRWQTSSAFQEPVKLVKNKETVLHVEPWLFRDKVVELYAQNPSSIKYNDTFPWASIWQGPELEAESTSSLDQ